MENFWGECVIFKRIVIPLLQSTFSLATFGGNVNGVGDETQFIVEGGSRRNIQSSMKNYVSEPVNVLL